MRIENCKKILFPKIEDYRGNLAFVENLKHIPFEIKRIYYLFDIPKGSKRGGHAHKDLYQIIIPITGSFEVIIDDGSKSKRILLDNADEGLLITPYIWREIENFTEGSTALVLASNFYDEKDYLRDYENFKTHLSNEKK